MLIVFITYKRRKKTGKREDDFSDLLVKTIVYKLEEGEQSCAFCGNSLNDDRDAQRDRTGPAVQGHAAYSSSLCVPPLRSS